MVCHARARIDRSSYGRGPLAIATPRTGLDDLAEVLHLGDRRAIGPGRARVRRQPRRHQRQVERCCAPDVGSCLDHTRIAQRTGAPVRHHCADAHPSPPAATGRARRGCVGRAPRRWRSPAGVAPAPRSARCWWRRRPGRCGRPTRPRHRCAPSRADRRDPTTRPPHGRARRHRPTAATRAPRHAAHRPSAPPARRPCGIRS